MKKTLATLATAMLLATGLGTPAIASQDAVSEQQVTAQGTIAEPDAIEFQTLSRNLWQSEMNVVVASGRGGSGTQQILRPATHSSRDTDSVYVYWAGQKIPGTNTRCYTYINNQIRGAGWVDTLSWRSIDVNIQCR